MKFSIVTPSFRSSRWLKLCINSVADQQVELEHIIQDAESDDGTLEWLPKDNRVRSFIEKDTGMYDAINRGLGRAEGDILAHLNADEQYLPGALQAIDDFFRQNPTVEIVHADTVVVDAEGQFICCRKSMKPLRLLMYTENPTITSSVFFRRSVIEKRRILFDPNWKMLGDAVWMRECTRQRLRTAVLRRYTSVFTETGDNLDLSPAARAESLRLRETCPWWARTLELPLRTLGRMRRFVKGNYRQTPFDYEMYLLSSPEERRQVHVSKPTCIWWTRAPRRAGSLTRQVRRTIGAFQSRHR